MTGVVDRCLSGLYDAKILVDEEANLSPTLAFFFRGCDLWCRFCMDHEYAWSHSENWLINGETFRRLLVECLSTDKNGLVRTVSLIGGEPSNRWHDVGQALAELRTDVAGRRERVSIPPLVLNSNMLFPPGQGPETWAGVVDWFLADLKFGNDSCAEKLTLPEAPARKGGHLSYLARVKENILTATQVGKVLIRHLVLPGHLRCCTEPILKWVKDELPDVDVHLLLDYYPNGCSGLRGLERMLSPEEKREAYAIARDYGVNLYSSTGHKELKGGEIVVLSALESEMHGIFQRYGCAFRRQILRVSSDGSLIVPDLSASLDLILRSLRS